MKNLPTFEEFINESYNIQENLIITDLDVRDDVFFLNINGNEYGYKSKDMNIQAVVDKFKSILKHNTGRALSWLKKNTELIVGSKKNEGEIFESSECTWSGGYDEIDDDIKKNYD